MVAARLLGRPTSAFAAQSRLVGPVAFMSAFVNNTPLVAVYLPLVSSLARRSGVPASQLFLPLSYAAILGGVCTLIGTSTNVVVNGLILDYNRTGTGTPISPFSMFSLSPVGLPVAAIGLAYVMLAGRRLLPARATGARARPRPPRLHGGAQGRARRAGGRVEPRSGGTAASHRPLPGAHRTRARDAACGRPRRGGARRRCPRVRRRPYVGGGTASDSRAVAGRLGPGGRDAPRPSSRRSRHSFVVVDGRPDDPRRRLPHQLRRRHRGRAPARRAPGRPARRHPSAAGRRGAHRGPARVRRQA